MLAMFVGLCGIVVGLAVGRFIAERRADALRLPISTDGRRTASTPAQSTDCGSVPDCVPVRDATSHHPETIAALSARLVQSQGKLQEHLPRVESRLLTQLQDLQTSLAQVRVDRLTGLPDQLAFEAELCRRLAEWRRKHMPLAVMRIDLDYFQRVNQQYGPAIGDELLRGVALVLRGSLRDMDLIARLGRDEFAVLLPQTTSRESATVAKRVRADVAAALFPMGDLRLKVTVSVGCAAAAPGDHVALLMERADAALHASKRGGRNAVHVYTRRGLKSVPAFEPEGFLPVNAEASA